MGPKICPSTPCMVNSGTKAVTVIAAVKNTALSTCKALAKMIRNRSVQPSPAAWLPVAEVGSGPQ